MRCVFKSLVSFSGGRSIIYLRIQRGSRSRRMPNQWVVTCHWIAGSHFSSPIMAGCGDASNGRITATARK